MLRYALFGPNAGQFIDVPDETATAGVSDGWLLDPEQMGNPMDTAPNPDVPFDYMNPPASITDFYKEAYNVPEGGDGGNGGGTPEPGADPVISSLNPASAPVDTPTTISVTGTDFAPDAVVRVDGADVVTTVETAGTVLSADLPGMLSEATLDITVRNVADGTESAASPFTVTAV